MPNPESPSTSVESLCPTTAPVVSSHYTAVLMLVFLVLSTSTFFLFTFPAVAEELAPAAPGSIAGTIQNDKNEPQAAINVTLYQFSLNSAPPWREVRRMTTELDGQYRFALLPAGMYRVGATDPQKLYAPVYYPNAPLLALGTDLSVVGNQLTAINMMLQPGGTITGVVMVTGSLPITEGYVTLYWAGERAGSPTWESVQSLPLSPTNGAYAFTGLSALPYRICANVVNPIFFWYECYPNAYTVNEATSLTVTLGATISNVNLLLGDPPISTITSRFGGRVTSVDNQPLADIEIYASPVASQTAADWTNAIVRQNHRRDTGSDSVQQPRDLPPLYRSFTDQNGNYDFAISGRYRLFFRDLSGQYAFEYYNNSVLAEAATVVEVAENAIITDLNIQLVPGSHLDGYITLFGQPVPEGYVSAEMQTPAGWQYANSAAIDGTTGHYNIGGLPAGIYRVTASSYVNGSYPPYIGYFGGSTLEMSAEITLAVGVTKTADIILSGEPTFAGSVSGQVTRADGMPVAGAKVYLSPGIMMNCCNQWIPQPQVYTFTDAEGRYAINGLNTILFGIGVFDPAGTYATTYYPHFALPASASALYIENGMAFTETNITMPLAGAISGRVRTAKGAAVANLRVSAYAADPTFEANYASIRLVSSNTHTDAEGHYLVQGLHATTYYVCFTEVQSSSYSECYGSSTVSYGTANGIPVNVVAGTTTNGIDLLWGLDLANYLPLIAR